MNKSLISLEVKVRCVISGSIFLFVMYCYPQKKPWPLLEKPWRWKCISSGSNVSISVGLTVAVYEVPSNVAAYFFQFGEIVNALYDRMQGEWRFGLIVNPNAFISITYHWTRIDRWWFQAKTGHLSDSYPWKKTPEKLSLFRIPSHHLLYRNKKRLP